MPSCRVVFSHHPASVHSGGRLPPCYGFDLVRRDSLGARIEGPSTPRNPFGARTGEPRGLLFGHVVRIFQKCPYSVGLRERGVVAQSKPKKEPVPTPAEVPSVLESFAEPRLGRLRAAWSVLWGERLVPMQIQGEWIEYQQIFESILQRLSAQLARQARSEKLRLESLIPEEPSHREPSRHDHKADLRKRANAMRGLNLPSRPGRPPGPEAALIIDNAKETKA